MEKTMEILKLADLREKSIRKSLDQAHSQASSILLFTLQWKDLEAQFDLARADLLKQAQELAFKEKTLVENTRMLEQRDQDVEIKLGKVEKGLDELERKEKKLEWIEECGLKLSSIENKLNLARKEVDGCDEMLKMKRDQLVVVQNEVRKCINELRAKEKHLHMVQKCVEECNVELESKEMKLGLVNSQLGECSKELVLKQKELDVVINLISDSNAEHESKKRELQMLRDFSDKCSGDLNLKSRKLSGIEESIGQEVDLERKEFDSVENLKEHALNRVENLIRESSKDVDSIKVLIGENKDKLGVREKQLGLIEESIKNNPTKRWSEENSIISHHRQAPEIGDDLPGHLKIEQPGLFCDSDRLYSSFANCQYSTTTDQWNFTSVLEDDVGSRDLEPHKVLDTLKMSSDPARFVLVATQELYSQQQKNANAELGGTNIVKRQILLLEQLMKVSPKISPQLKNEARELAVSWKENRTLDNQNSMEVWAFLLFSLIYGFVSHLGRDEVFRLLSFVAHRKQAPEICRILGFKAQIPEVIQSLIERNRYIESVRFSCAFGLMDKFPPEIILEQYMEKLLTCDRISTNEKDLVKAQAKAIDSKIIAHQSILDCLAECKFESILLTQKINRCISELERQKSSSVSSSPAPPLVSQPHGGNYHPNPRRKESPAPVVQQQPYRKRPRMDVST